MNTHDTYSSAVKLSEETIKFLCNYEVSPTPINFSVIYYYLSKKDEKMNLLLDEYISWNGSLDAVFIESLFLEFFSNSEDVEKMFITPFENTLTSTMEQLERQAINGEQIAKNFKKADRVLANSDQASSLKPLVRFINSTLIDSQQQHNDLTSELEKTYNKVNQLKSQLKASREEAMRDSLTGLYNRRGCEEKLKDLALESTHASVSIDIDHFKKFNDEFGHAIGDKVIQRVASTIQDHISSTDFAVRFGGEEFMVVLANKTKEEAKNIAEKIRIAITNLKLKQKKSNTYLPSISISAGVAEYQEYQNWKSVFEVADSALYQAKHAGRNCCVVL
ncbi:GGDEF domain-containing protein [Colwellia sp. 1_MG-2023]|uniref:GGDEF domain-containing protein n=1 Tax=Colwellia sp. 1_MG-2023 TaxID=3062649 RepID=UPI0026E2F4D4|nr:GGDEF domain-containing protein [Colwellia sp. 1_MG-2023]MDO6445636.1 GGDEF domain-containing protein [Colwellia sp. 1_MG-2023]